MNIVFPFVSRQYFEKNEQIIEEIIKVFFFFFINDAKYYIY